MSASTSSATGRPRVATAAVLAGLLLASLLLAGIVSYYADNDPDGLSKVAAEQGFSQTEKDHATADGPFAGYSSSFVDNERLSGGLAGVVGVVSVLLLAGGLVLVVRRRAPHDEPV